MRKDCRGMMDPRKELLSVDSEVVKKEPVIRTRRKRITDKRAQSMEAFVRNPGSSPL